MSRSTWHEVGLAMAETMATRSPCEKMAVGAVIASADWRQWAVGYNGFPAGLELRAGEGCGSMCPQGAGSSDVCWAVHAEMNALMQSSRSMREGGTMFITTSPCLKCSLAIANSGLTTVLYPRPLVLDTPAVDRAKAARELFDIMNITAVAL